MRNRNLQCEVTFQEVVEYGRDSGLEHGIVYDNDPELASAKGDVLEAFDQAKK